LAAVVLIWLVLAHKQILHPGKANLTELNRWATVAVAIIAALIYILWFISDRRVRLRQVFFGESAARTFANTGRLLGVFGAVFLAEAIEISQRWGQFQQKWDRSVPFGVLLVVFLSVGVSAGFSRSVYPVLGVLAAVAITLLAGGLHGQAEYMFLAATCLITLGGMELLLAPLARPDYPKDKRRVYLWFYLGTVICLAIFLAIIRMAETAVMVGVSTVLAVSIAGALGLMPTKAQPEEPGSADGAAQTREEGNR
jgi:hypothetical protein